MKASTVGLTFLCGLVCSGCAWGAEAAPATDSHPREAEVVAVVPYRGPGRGPRRPARITIELDDGTRHRLWLRPPLPKPGEKLPVRILGGEVRVR